MYAGPGQEYGKFTVLSRTWIPSVLRMAGGILAYRVVLAPVRGGV